MLKDREAIFEARDLAVHTETEPWKHGHSENIVFKHPNGKHYEFSVDFHPSEGMQVYGTVVAHRVVPRRKLIEEWVGPGDSGGQQYPSVAELEALLDAVELVRRVRPGAEPWEDLCEAEDPVRHALGTPPKLGWE